MKRNIFRFRGSYLSYVFIFFFTYVGMAAFCAVLSVYLTDIGKTAAEMSFIVSGGGLFSLATVPVTGYLCDRLKRPRLICGALVLAMGVLALVFPFCRQVWALFVLNGLITSLLNAIMPVGERLAGAARFRYGSLRVWGTLGYAAGAQAAGLAFQTAPVVLFVLVFVSALLAVLGYAGAEDLPSAAGPEKRERPPLASFLQNRQFLLFLLILVLVMSCSGANMTFTPVLLSSLGVSTGAVGTVLSISTLTEIPLILFSHKYMDRFSGKALLLAAAGIMEAEFLVFVLARAAWAAVAAVILLKAVASTMLMMILLKIVRNLVDPALTSTGLSLANTAGTLGAIALQNAGGAIVDAAGIFPLYAVMAGLTGLGMLLALFLRVKNEEAVFG